jgi:DNA-binding transcriptional LysR family regulator
VTDSLYAIVHPQHAGLRRQGVRLADVAARPLALPDETLGLRHMLDAAAKAAGFVLALRGRTLPIAVRRYGEQPIEVSKTLARSGFGGGAA